MLPSLFRGQLGIPERAPSLAGIPLKKKKKTMWGVFLIGPEKEGKKNPLSPSGFGGTVTLPEGGASSSSFLSQKGKGGERGGCLLVGGQWEGGEKRSLKPFFTGVNIPSGNKKDLTTRKRKKKKGECRLIPSEVGRKKKKREKSCHLSQQQK